MRVLLSSFVEVAGLIQGRHECCDACASLRGLLTVCTTQCSRPIVAHSSHAKPLAPLCLLGTTRSPCTTSATLGGVQAQDTSHRYVQAAHLTCSLPCMPFKPLHNRMIKFVWLPVNIAPSLLCPAAACVQVVWKSTTNVGCAVRKCNTMAGMSATWNNAYFTVCRYRCVIMGIVGATSAFAMHMLFYVRLPRHWKPCTAWPITALQAQGSTQAT